MAKQEQEFHVLIETINVLTQGANTEHDSVILIDPDPLIVLESFQRYRKLVIQSMGDTRYIEYNQYPASFSFKFRYSQEAVFVIKFNIDKWSKSQVDAFQFFNSGGLTNDANKA